MGGINQRSPQRRNMPHWAGVPPLGGGGHDDADDATVSKHHENKTMPFRVKKTGPLTLTTFDYRTQTSLGEDQIASRSRVVRPRRQVRAPPCRMVHSGLLAWRRTLCVHTQCRTGRSTLASTVGQRQRGVLFLQPLMQLLDLAQSWRAERRVTWWPWQQAHLSQNAPRSE